LEAGWNERDNACTCGGEAAAAALRMASGAAPAGRTLEASVGGAVGAAAGLGVAVARARLAAGGGADPVVAAPACGAARAGSVADVVGDDDPDRAGEEFAVWTGPEAGWAAMDASS
jgi:hypothetical protein